MLRSALYALADPGSLHASDGEFPVHIDTEVRLFKLDSLEYGLDALRGILEAPIYNHSALLSNLRYLFEDFSTAKAIKQLRNSQPYGPPSSASLQEYYMASAQSSPHMWFSSGLMDHMFNYKVNVTKEHANFLSMLVPKIIFGTPGAPTSSDHNSDIKLPLSSIPDSHVEACIEIAMWTCMPYDYDLNAFRDAFRAANGNLVRHNALWKPLRNAGLIQISLEHTSNQNDPSTSNPSRRSSLPTHANGHWIYIKARLIESLHSFPVANSLTPDVLEWSIALADHLAELLAYWDDAEMDPDEHTYVIGSLVKLINTLLGAPGLNESPEAPTSIQEDMSPAHIRLEKMIRWGVFKILARPFSNNSAPTSPNKWIPETAAWYKDLAETIDRLARRFPILASSNEFSPPYNDLVAYYKRMKGVNSSSLTLDQVTRLQEDIMYQLA